MRASTVICFTVVAILAATSARAGEITVVSNVRGPEGPLYVDGNLYYVGWVSDTLSKWDGKTTTVLDHTPGCGHNGLALTKKKTFLLACTDDPGAILELDMTGKQLRRWDADSNGKKFVGGINDVVVAPSTLKPAALDPILTRDFVFVTPGPESKGLAEAKTSFHRLAATRPDVIFVHEPKELQAYEPWEIVAESGTWYEKWSEPDGETLLNGRYLAMWVLDHQHWRLKSELIVPTKCQGSRYCTKMTIWADHLQIILPEVRGKLRNRRCA